MARFKIGDIITGKPVSRNHCVYTTDKATMKVTAIGSGDNIRVKITNHTYHISMIGREFDVKSKHFILQKSRNKLTKCKICRKKLKTYKEIYDSGGNEYCEDCFNENFVKCDICGNGIEIGDEIEVGSEILCNACFDENYRICEHCGEPVHIDNTHYFDNEPYCDDCFDEIFIICDVCGTTVNRDDAFFDEYSEQNLCEDCYSQRESEPDIDFFGARESLLIDKNLGTVPAFGVELECKTDSNNYYVTEHKSAKYFSATEDGSLGDNGVEYVSVPLTFNKKGFSILKSFTELVKREHETDDDCGCHIHINLMPYVNVRKDNINKSVSLTKRLLVGYRNIEKTMFNAMPRGRGGSYFANSFKSMYDDSEIFDKKGWKWISDFYGRDLKDKKNIPQHKGHRKRYCWINAHAIFFKNTLEIRLLEGTLDYDTIRNWVNINRKIIDYLATNNMNKAIKFNKNKLFRILNKTERDFLLKRIMLYN